ASGRTVDFRSDQFAFGSILYEMATGTRAFQKGSAVDTLSAILHEDPKSVGDVNPAAPVPLRWIVARCLAKDPEDRYQATRDLARDLATVRDHLSEVTRSPETPAVFAPSPRRRAWIRAAIAILFAVALGITAWRLRRPVWFNPLAGARYSRFTSWEGSEL